MSASRPEAKTGLVGGTRRNVPPLAFAWHLLRSDLLFQAVFEFAIIGAFVLAFAILFPKSLGSSHGGDQTTQTRPTPAPTLVDNTPKPPQAKYTSLESEIGSYAIQSLAQANSDEKSLVDAPPGIQFDLQIAFRHLHAKDPVSALQVLNKLDPTSPIVAYWKAVAIAQSNTPTATADALKVLRAATASGYGPAYTLYGNMLLSMIYASERGRLPASALVTLDGAGNATPATTQQLAMEAVQWWERGSATGNSQAERMLGAAEARGFSGRISFAAAAAHWREAVRAGDTISKVELGELYMHGLGVPASADKAADLFREAFADGMIPAGLLLAVVLRDVTTDKALALQEAKTALIHGIRKSDVRVDAAAAHMMLGFFYAEVLPVDEQSPLLATANWYAAAVLGNEIAKGALAKAYAVGHGVERDRAKAVGLMRSKANATKADVEEFILKYPLLPDEQQSLDQTTFYLLPMPADLLRALRDADMASPLLGASNAPVDTTSFLFRSPAKFDEATLNAAAAKQPDISWLADWFGACALARQQAGNKPMTGTACGATPEFLLHTANLGLTVRPDGRVLTKAQMAMLGKEALTSTANAGESAMAMEKAKLIDAVHIDPQPTAVAHAHARLGDLYAGLLPDDQRDASLAVANWLAAAALGDTTVFDKIARAYATGAGVERDRKRALAFLRLDRSRSLKDIDGLIRELKFTADELANTDVARIETFPMPAVPRQLLQAAGLAPWFMVSQERSWMMEAKKWIVKGELTKSPFPTVPTGPMSEIAEIMATHQACSRSQDGKTDIGIECRINPAFLARAARIGSLVMPDGSTIGEDAAARQIEQMLTPPPPEPEDKPPEFASSYPLSVHEAYLRLLNGDLRHYIRGNHCGVLVHVHPSGEADRSVTWRITSEGVERVRFKITLHPQGPNATSVTLDIEDFQERTPIYTEGIAKPDMFVWRPALLTPYRGGFTEAVSALLEDRLFQNVRIADNGHRTRDDSTTASFCDSQRSQLEMQGTHFSIHDKIEGHR